VFKFSFSLFISVLEINATAFFNPLSFQEKKKLRLLGHQFVVLSTYVPANQLE